MAVSSIPFPPAYQLTLQLVTIRGFGNDVLYKSTFYITLHYISEEAVAVPVQCCV